MKLVLDTHALIWAFHGSPRLGRTARAFLSSVAAVDCGYSDVTLSETGRLIAGGRLRLAAGVDGGAYLKALAAHAAVVPVSPEIAWLAASLSWANHDPCDRHIVATALSLNVPLLSADAVITKAASALGLTVVW